MPRRTKLVTGVGALIVLTLACASDPAAPLAPTSSVTSTTSSTASDGSTLKATAPVPVSPVNDQRVSSQPMTLTVTASTMEFGGSIVLQYRFEIFNAAGTRVESAVVTTPVYTVTVTLVGQQRHTWRARAEFQGSVGPWSTTASFIAPDVQFIRGSQVLDPLTNGKTAGIQHGGTFLPGQGWRSDTYFDGIDYDIQTCNNCTLEFDVTNMGKGLGNPGDLKWVCMGDASAFGDFMSFRNHDWKMHLEQRGDGDGTGMKLIWRVNGEDDDHVTKVEPGPNWTASEVYHFVFRWTPASYSIRINGEEWFAGAFKKSSYAPPNHRISLGCYPRGESFTNAIFRNVKVNPN